MRSLPEQHMFATRPSSPPPSNFWLISEANRNPLQGPFHDSGAPFFKFRSFSHCRVCSDFPSRPSPRWNPPPTWGPLFFSPLLRAFLFSCLRTAACCGFIRKTIFLSPPPPGKFAFKSSDLVPLPRRAVDGVSFTTRLPWDVIVPQVSRFAFPFSGSGGTSWLAVLEELVRPLRVFFGKNVLRPFP